MNYFKRVAKYTPTRLWINNVTREEAQLAISAGAIGCTQNPAFISKVIKSESDGEYVRTLFDCFLREYSDDDTVITLLQTELIKNLCAYFLPLYQESCGQQGFVSIQANPFRENEETILQSAYAARKAAENMIIKIPATKAGINAMRVLVRDRIPILATEIMSIDQVIAVCEMHREATKDLDDPAPFYFAHINGIFDEHLIDFARNNHIDIDYDALHCASFAIARKMVECVEKNGYKVRYLAGGARGMHHFSDMVGVNGSVTINWRGTADKLIEADAPVVDRFSANIPQSLLDELLDKIPDFKTAFTPNSLQAEDFENFGPVVRFRNQFEKGWQDMRDYAAQRRTELH